MTTRPGTTHPFRRRAIALTAAVTLITPIALTTLARPAAASSVPGSPGTPVAVGMQGAAALRWTAPANVGSPSLSGYRVEANDGSGWSTAVVHHGADALVSGAHHTCALLDTGQVKCWGDNANGQLGQGDTTARGDGPNEMGENLPAIALGTNRTATAITAGNNHTCALLDNGNVKCWGANDVGQLGQGDTTQRGDNVNEMGNNLTPIDLGTGRTAGAITAGPDFTCALLDNGSVKCWGDNGLGQLGLGDTTNRGVGPNQMGDNLPAVSLGTGRTAVAIATGSAHTCALLDTGTVKCWGYNFYGQLGQGDTASRGDGANEMGDNLPAIDLGTGRTAISISAGDDDTCAVLDNASLKCWGRNANGELGQGDTTSRGDNPNEMGNNLPAVTLGAGRSATTVTSGSAHTCALLDNATVKCWGYNGFGQLGQGDTNQRGDNANEMGDNLPAISLGTGRTATAITADANNTCALLDNAAVKCWGNNDLGQLGQGDTNVRGDGAGEMGNNLSVVAIAGQPPIAIAGGGAHNCAVLADGSLKCWGQNTWGQLGLGDTNDRGDQPNEMGSNLPAIDLGTGRSATAVVGGDTDTCALLDNGSVKCWGRSFAGELGQGNTLTIGNAANEMGDNLPAISLGTGRTATAITAGSNHVCALLDNATVKCWGRNQRGQLGQGDTTSRGDNANEMGNNLTPINLGTGRTATAISAGGDHTCAVLDNGSLKCWGDNFNGKLGLGDTQTRGDQAGSMGDNLPAISLGTGRTATAVAAGVDYTCALLDNATVKCWGWGGSGRLGQGDTTDRGDNANEMGDNLPAIDLGTGRTAASIAASGSSVCALLDNGSVKCWGNNSSGNLGDGDTVTRGDNANEMGDNLPAVSLGTGRTATAIESGGFGAGACAFLDNGSVKCWGSNGNGRLGLGDATTRGNTSGQMGDNLPAVAVSDIASSAPATSAIARLAPGSYTFRVVALNSVGESAPSSVSSSVTVTGVAGAPTAVTATPDDQKAFVSWTAPANNGGFTITDYAVSVYDASGGAPTGVTGQTMRLIGSATTTFSFTGLTNGTQYTFRVAAVNSSGTGAQSSLSTAVVPASFTVPASAADPDGYDTGTPVNNSVTLTATGGWCYAALHCFGPAGDTPPNPGGAGYLEPTATKGALVGRLGTSGPWTEIGSGPQTLNGTGELYLAINDQTGGYGDNTGSLQVNLAASLFMISEYAGAIPEMLTGQTIPWEGVVNNFGNAPLTNLKVFASAASGLPASRTSVPTWRLSTSTDATDCTLQTQGTTTYTCEVPSLPAGVGVVVDANVFAHGLAPQTLGDLLAVGISDQTGGCFGFCPEHVPVKPTTNVILDGLQFHITAPATVGAGSTLTISGYVENTSPSQAINQIATVSTFDKGTVTGATNCSFQNGATGGAADRCPGSGTFDLPAGTDSSSFPASVDIDTTGLAGQTIHYTTVGTSPGIGGSSQVVTGSVFVTTAPGGIAISTPASNATLARTQANDFTAVPSPGIGNNVTSVGFQVDGGAAVNDTTAPYSRTLGANSLSAGTHTLKATMHQDNGGADAVKTITVNVAGAPTATIVPPAGFTSGGSLSASKTFTATVAPSSPATIASVVWQIDGTTTLASSATSPYSVTLNPATLALDNGSHQLNLTATDSLGQIKTAAFNFTMPLATLTIPTITSLATSVTPGGDAAWTVTVNNPSPNFARHVTLTLDATATAPDSTITPLTFDTAAINGALHKLSTAPTCAPDSPTSLVCNVGDLGGSAGVQFPVFALTDNVANGSTVIGTAVVAASNANDSAPNDLDSVSVDSCGTVCVEGVAAAGTAFANDSDANNVVVVQLSNGLTSIAHGVKFGRPFRLAKKGAPHGRVTFRPRLDTNPSVKIRLNSYDPSASTDPIDASLCPTSTCLGQISEVSGIFTPYTNQADPIVAVIIAKWGPTVPSGGIWMQKPAVGNGPIPPPIHLAACSINATTRAFNTPCVLPEIVKTLTVGMTTTKTTYSTVLFTGNDPHFARR